MSARRSVMRHVEAATITPGNVYWWKRPPWTLRLSCGHIVTVRGYRTGCLLAVPQMRAGCRQCWLDRQTGGAK